MNMKTINELIKDSGLTQKFISERLGMTEQNFCLVKKNFGKLTITNFATLADLLNTDLEELYECLKAEQRRGDSLKHLFGGLNPVQQLDDIINDLNK